MRKGVVLGNSCNDDIGALSHARVSVQGCLLLLEPDCLACAEIYTIRGTYIYITVLSYPVDMLGFARSRYRACFSGDPVAEYRPRAREGGNQPSGRLWDERV
jgi:hypothetical protein